MKKNTNKIGKVKPNPLAWFIYVTGSKIYMSKRNKVIIDRTVFKNRNKKEGCIVLYNHSSNKDHFVTTLSFGFTRVAYVTTSHFYYSKKLSFVLKLARAIPKEQFKSDVSTIKKIKRALNKKVPVAIAPTGQITVHGDALYFDPSIVKLLKMCKVDVYAIRMHGNYYAYPKWRKYYRDVPIHSEFVKVIDKKELETLSDDEIYKRTYDAINVNDRQEQSKYNYQLHSQGLIEGIEDILYQCPKCMQKYQMATSKDLLICNFCGNTVKMNEKGFLEGVSQNYVLMQNEAEWYKWEQRKMIQEINNNTFKLEGKFKLITNLHEQYVLEEAGTGKLVLTPDRFYYEGYIGDEIKTKEFKLDRLVQLPFEVRKHFDIPDDEGYFEFIPTDDENKAKIIQFVQAVEVISAMRQNRSLW